MYIYKVNEKCKSDKYQGINCKKKREKELENAEGHIGCRYQRSHYERTGIQIGL